MKLTTFTIAMTIVFLTAALCFPALSADTEDTAKARSGKVIIMSVPMGCDVTFRGGDIKLQNSQITIDPVSVGKYPIEFTRNGSTLKGEVDVRPGEALVVSGDFKQNKVVIELIEAREVARKMGRDGAPMALIPAGDFRMGSDSGEDDEKPFRAVYVDAFYMDIYEVTNAQYKKFVDAKPEWRKDRIDKKYHNGNYLKNWEGGSYRSGEEDHPVVFVSWHAAKAYAQWTGKRLPTEAEWEKAARGGLAGRRYPWGDSMTHDSANYVGRISKDTWENTAPVGSLAPNAYGLYDMVGNVWEWCEDWYDKGYYVKSPQRNPKGPNSGKFRVLRGGSWEDSLPFLRVANRFNAVPAYTDGRFGFRCAGNVTP